MEHEIVLKSKELNVANYNSTGIIAAISAKNGCLLETAKVNISEIEHLGERDNLTNNGNISPKNITNYDNGVEDNENHNDIGYGLAERISENDSSVLPQKRQLHLEGIQEISTHVQEQNKSYLNKPSPVTTNHCRWPGKNIKSSIIDIEVDQQDQEKRTKQNRSATNLISQHIDDSNSEQQIEISRRRSIVLQCFSSYHKTKEFLEKGNSSSSDDDVKKYIETITVSVDFNADMDGNKFYSKSVANEGNNDINLVELDENNNKNINIIENIVIKPAIQICPVKFNDAQYKPNLVLRKSKESAREISTVIPNHTLSSRLTSKNHHTDLDVSHPNENKTETEGTKQTNKKQPTKSKSGTRNNTKNLNNKIGPPKSKIDRNTNRKTTTSRSDVRKKPNKYAKDVRETTDNSDNKSDAIDTSESEGDDSLFNDLFHPKKKTNKKEQENNEKRPKRKLYNPNDYEYLKSINFVNDTLDDYLTLSEVEKLKRNQKTSEFILKENINRQKSRKLKSVKKNRPFSSPEKKLSNSETLEKAAATSKQKRISNKEIQEMFNENTQLLFKNYPKHRVRYLLTRGDKNIGEKNQLLYKQWDEQFIPHKEFILKQIVENGKRLKNKPGKTSDLRITSEHEHNS